MHASFDSIIREAFRLCRTVGGMHRVYRRDASRLFIVCEHGKDACSFFVRAVATQHKGKGTAKITTLCTNHTCGNSTGVEMHGRVRNPSTKFLLSVGDAARVVRDITPVRGAGTTASVRSALQSTTGVRVTYQQAHKLHTSLANRTMSLCVKQFALLQHFLQRCRERDPGGTFVLETDDAAPERNEGRGAELPGEKAGEGEVVEEAAAPRFKRVYSAYGAVKNFFQHSRRIVCLDGTHLSSPFQGKGEGKGVAEEERERDPQGRCVCVCVCVCLV